MVRVRGLIHVHVEMGSTDLTVQIGIVMEYQALTPLRAPITVLVYHPINVRVIKVISERTAKIIIVTPHYTLTHPFVTT